MIMPLDASFGVEGDIRAAFRDVTLGRGVSLRQAELIDRGQDASRGARSASLGHEIVSDWSKVSLDELERNCIAHLDAEDFRYYIPALMLSVLDHYDPSSMRVFGTLGGLYPKKDHWAYHMHRYSLLSTAQKTAIARFLEALPRVVDLNHEDQQIVLRALRNYWSEFLEAGAK